MTLSACYGVPVEEYDAGPPCTDADSDGYCVIDGDCNDNDFDIHPNAVDTLGDGIDQDCSGADGTDADAGM